MTDAASRRGVKLTSRSRPLCPEDFDRFEYIVCMDASNRTSVMRAADGWEGEGRAAKGELRAKAEERTRMMHTFCSKYNVGEVPDPYYGGAQVRRRVCANARAGALARATTCGSARMSCAALTASTPLPAAAHSHRYGLGRVSRPCSTCSMTPARGCLPTSTPSARSSWPACPHPPPPTPHRAALRRCLLARPRARALCCAARSNSETKAGSRCAPSRARSARHVPLLATHAVPVPLHAAVPRTPHAHSVSISAAAR